MRFTRFPVSGALYLAFLISASSATAQMITGTWHGRISRQKAEVKIVQSGDSLTGTSYYYESPSNYRRYSIRGYFDPETNAAVWWDDQLLEEKSGRFSITSPGKNPQLSSADFNCPGSGRMLLDGKSGKKEEEPNGEVHLMKNEGRIFTDEWDFVIDNYTVGANDPDLIDSVRNIAFHQPEETTPVQSEPVQTIQVPPPPSKEPEPVLVKPHDPQQDPKPVINTSKPVPVIQPPPVLVKKEIPIEEKYRLREKQLTKEIPVKGDTLELRFYDNAEVDGDSISLFLNGKLMFEHIRLTAVAYSIKIPVSSLLKENELTMVAENLGSIPPNTSYMVALMGDDKYDAYLASTEGSSAMIRLRKE